MASGLPRMRGRSEHSLDDKGRVIIPQRFRETLGDEFMLVTAPGPCLRIYPMSVFEKMEDELESTSVLDEANEDKQMMQRLFYDGDVGSLDQQFRLTLPKALRNWCGFGKQENETVVIVGMGEKLELWTHPTWEAYKAKFDTKTTTDASNRLRAAIAGKTFVDSARPDRAESDQ
jgi:MraZ protein